ncbi:MAG: hypothetical protein OXC11_09730 [Rhodospirillales bacterium]|nr:hypothetical protein [Rhodospirillales bacterium]
MREFDDGLPILLGYQSRWNAERADVAICDKSRRIGLSWGDAAERVLWAAQGKGNVYYMSYNKDMTAGYIEDCAEWARYHNLAAGAIEETLVTDEDRQFTVYQIRMDSGKSVVALPGEARNLRSKGRPGDIVIVDEAAYCDDLRALIKAALAFTQWGGQVRLISTGNGQDNPFQALIEDVEAGKLDYGLHRITIDDAIADGLARRIFTVRGKPWYEGAEADWRTATFAKYRYTEDAEEELLCVPKRSAGVYFPRSLVRPCMAEAPIVRYTGDEAFNRAAEPERRKIMAGWIDSHVQPLLEELDPFRRHAFGMDFGRVGDLSVVVPLEVTATAGYRCPFMVELKNVPHKQQEQVVDAVGGGLPRFFACKLDGTGNGSFVAEAAVDAFGEHVAESVHLTTAWYVEHLPAYKASLQDRTMQIPLSDDLLDDHLAFQVVGGIPRLPKARTGQKRDRHGDGAMALILAHAAAASEAREYEFEGAGERSAVAEMDDYLDGGSMRAAWQNAASRRAMHGDVMRW